MALVYMMRGKAKLWTRYLVRMGFRRIRSVTQSIGKSKKCLQNESRGARKENVAKGEVALQLQPAD